MLYLKPEFEHLVPPGASPTKILTIVTSIGNPLARETVIKLLEHGPEVGCQSHCERWLGNCCEVFMLPQPANRRPTKANTGTTTAYQAGQRKTHACSMKKAGWAKIVHLSLRAEKMIVMCLSAVAVHLPSHQPLPPFGIIMYYCPLLRDGGCGTPQGQFGGVGGDEGKAQQGASLLLKRLEHWMASHEPPQGPPEAHTTLILVELSSSMGREGSEAY